MQITVYEMLTSEEKVYDNTIFGFSQRKISVKQDKVSYLKTY